MGARVMYPCVVEFCLNADILAFFVVLGAEDLEFFWFERAATC
jgi:hypothetical protein